MNATAPARGLRRVVVVLAVLLLFGAAAAAVTWAAPAAEVTPPPEGAALGQATPAADAPAPSLPAQVADEEPVVTEPEPEALGFSAGSVSPTWTGAIASAGDGPDGAADAVATGLRTVYVTGTVWSASTSSDLSLAKYVDGTRVWLKTYDGPYHGADHGYAVAARASAIYTAGQRQHSGADPSDIVLTRWDRDGRRLWTRAYDSGDRRDDWAVDVVVDGSGNVTVLGESHSRACGADWVLISYTPDGVRRWVHRYDGPSHREDWPSAMTVDAAGRIYAVGMSTSAANGPDALVVKCSSAGARLWAKRFNGSGDGGDYAHAVRVRPGGGVYVAGSTWSTTSWRDGLLLAYTAPGSRVFAAVDPCVDPTSQTEQKYVDLEVLPGGHVLCGGHAVTPASDYEWYGAEFTAAGVCASRAVVTHAGNEFVSAMAKDAQGGVYITGTWWTGPGASQVLTQRVRQGGAAWFSGWPTTPTGMDEPSALAVNGVNAYVVGTHYDPVTAEDQFLLAYVY